MYVSFLGREKKRKEEKESIYCKIKKRLISVPLFSLLFLNFIRYTKPCRLNCIVLVELRLPSRTRLIVRGERPRWTHCGFRNSWKPIRSIFLGFYGFYDFQTIEPSLADKRIAVLFLEVTEIRRYRHAREVVEERYEGKEKNVWEVRERMWRGERSGARKVSGGRQKARLSIDNPGTAIVCPRRGEYTVLACSAYDK